MSLTDDFKCDSQGQRFADVWKDNRLDFNTVCNFFDNPCCKIYINEVVINSPQI